MTEYKKLHVLIVDRSTIKVGVPSGIPLSFDPKIPMNPLRERTIRILSRYLAEGRVSTRDELEVLGSQLFLALFDERLSLLFKDELEKVKKVEDSVLRLVLEFTEGARELAEFPWEYVYYPDGLHGYGRGFFIAADSESRLILARHVQSEIGALEAEPRPLKILVVVSQPEKYPEGEEPLGTVLAGAVTEAIKNLAERSGGAIRFDELRQPSKRSLTKKIDEFAPHVVHFLGHGRYVQGKGGALALVQEDQKTVAWISDEDLPDCFLPRPRLIFLHACEGAHTDSFEAFRGVALQLAYSRIAAVVAMQYQVENAVANRFALKFYESLGNGKPIDQAVQDGRLELGMYLKQESFSSRAFGSPVVFLQSADGIIKIAEAAEQQVDEPSKETASIKCSSPSCPNPSWVHPPNPRCSTCGAEYEPCTACNQLAQVTQPVCPHCGHQKVSPAGRSATEPVQRPGVAQYAGSDRGAMPVELAARPPRQPGGDKSDLPPNRANGQ